MTGVDLSPARLRELNERLRYGINVADLEEVRAILSALADRGERLVAERDAAEASADKWALVLMTARAEGAESLLLDVQRDCIAAVQRAEKAEAERDAAISARDMLGNMWAAARAELIELKGEGPGNGQ